ncbi:unnamed protein product [Polarella glacialis]|uniref:Uncharacterized protein n=1 Tax=Polarella glacialis TaxID=89957 RepID=A0A813GV55_POLGL|nr:unnamed protein product [Polarella glacialis]
MPAEIHIGTRNAFKQQEHQQQRQQQHQLAWFEKMEDSPAKKLTEDAPQKTIPRRNLGPAAFLIPVSVLLPNVLLVVLFSDIVVGLHVYTVFASRTVWCIGVAFCSVSFCACVGLYVTSWESWKSGLLRVLLAVPVYSLACVGTCLLSRDWPEAPVVVILFQIPVLICCLRATYHEVEYSKLFFWVSVNLFAMAAGMLALWLVWVLSPGIGGKSNYWNSATKDLLIERAGDLYREWKVPMGDQSVQLDYFLDCQSFVKANSERLSQTSTLLLSEAQLSKRSTACSKVHRTWFLLWVNPFIAFLVNLILASFLLLSTRYRKEEGLKSVERSLKAFILVILSLLLAMWVTVSVAAASMQLTATILAFCVAAVVALCAWIFHLLRDEIATLAETSPRMKLLVGFATSDWFWAGAFISLNLFLIVALLVDALKQKVSKIRGAKTTHRFSPYVQSVIEVLQQRSATSILCKVNLLCELYFLFSIGVAKATMVFLSWLNEYLMTLEFGVVIGVFFIIAFTLSMAPPVPGIPIYICAGIVISSRAKTTAVGYGGGIGIAIAVSMALKLTGVAAQYLTGFYMGKSVKIQQMVGVDQVAIRAVEKILRSATFSFPKVAVMVGGPDWPVSVLCGILRLNLWSILMATCPIIVVLSPCVIAGALMVGPEVATLTTTSTPSNSTSMNSSAGAEAEQQIWTTLSSTALALSALVQMMSGLLALYYIQEVVIADGPELEQYRAEHEPVAALTAQEKEYVDAFRGVSEWSCLGKFKQGLIIVGTSLMVTSIAVFVFLDAKCFRPFTVTSLISENFQNGGLDNNVLNLILDPGKVFLAVFGVACCFHYLFEKLCARAAKRHLHAKVRPEP